MSKIKDKVVVIMGASSGIGEATTKKLAQEGARLVIAARREDRLKSLVESLPNVEISFLVADVTNKEKVQAVVDFAVEKYGRVDVMYNNAGVMPLALLSENRFDEWRQMLEINIMGVLNGIAAALPIMKNNNQVILLRLILLLVISSCLPLPYIAERNLLFVPLWKVCDKRNMKTISVPL